MLRWIVGFNALFGLVRTVRHRGQAWGWIVVHGCLLGIVILGTLAGSAATGYGAGAIWVLFVLGPQLSARRMVRALDSCQLERAYRWARVTAALHPFDGLREQARLLGYEVHVERGRLDAARRALDSLLAAPGWAERARLEQYHLAEDWLRIVAQVGHEAPGTRSLRIAPLYLRALGEVGDLEKMWLTFERLPATVRALPLIRLKMAAFSGLCQGVDQILSSELPKLPHGVASVWRATACQRAGQPTVAHHQLRGLDDPSQAVLRLAESRRRAPLSPARLGDLSSHAKGVLGVFETTLGSPVVSPLSAERRRPWATFAIGLVLVVVFAIGAAGGAEDPQNLVNMGALVLPSDLVEGHVAWRVVAAGFLHFGATHLAVNLLGLWLLGREVERVWNGTVTLAVFLCSSVGAFALAVALVRATVEAPRVMLGASAGVLGLMGALLAFATVRYLRSGHQWLGRQVLALLAVIATQMVFDAFTPQVSSFLHLSGLVIGCVMGVGFSGSHRLRPYRKAT